jgi:hypothetical protein
MRKFGFGIPKTVQDAFQLDDQNKIDIWENAIKKEMGKVRVAFDVKALGEKAPVGFTHHIDCHLVFDELALAACIEWFRGGNFR